MAAAQADIAFQPIQFVSHEPTLSTLSEALSLSECTQRKTKIEVLGFCLDRFQSNSIHKQQTVETNKPMNQS